MRSFFRKYKLQIDVLLILVIAVGSVLYFIEYSEAANKKMTLVSAITAGLFAIIKTVDLVISYKHRMKAE